MTSPSTTPLRLAALLLISPLAAQTPLHEWSGHHDFDYWGTTVANVGDVDGDGREDIAVGSPSADYSFLFPPVTYANVGVVRVYSGATGALLWQKYGSLAGGDDLGAAICAAGDVNGDGLDDVVVGAPGADGFVTRGGEVYLYSGTGALLLTIQGQFTEARFGAAVAAGDIDGDGSPDVLIGSPQYDEDSAIGAFLEEGLVQVFRLSNGALLKWLEGGHISKPSVFDEIHWFRRDWGRAIAFLGDTDGNGFGEVAIGAPWTRQAGETSGFVRVFEPWTATDPTFGSHTIVDGNEDELFGASLASVEPGTQRYLVGIPSAAGGHGKVQLRNGTANEATFIGTADAPIGYEVAYAGDVDGDSHNDLLIGSPFADVISDTGLLMLDTGEVQVWSGTDFSLILRLTGDAPGDRFGDGVAGGRLDNDLISDVVVGASRDDSTGTNAGRVTAYHSKIPGYAITVGEGLAGTLGTPQLTAGVVPHVGAQVPITLSNSAGSSTVALVAIGDPVSLPFFGGTLHVLPSTLVSTALPFGGTTLVWSIGSNPTLFGTKVFLQSLVLDAGAPQGLALSAALWLSVGE